MLKYGYITDIAPDTGLFKVQFDENDIVSDWMPMISKKTLSGKGSVWDFLDVNEHVACLMEEGWDNGVILGAIFSEQDKPDSIASKDLIYISFSDGTKISYDRNAKELKQVLAGKLTVTAQDDISIEGQTKATFGASEKAIIDSPTVFLGSESNATHQVAYGDIAVEKISDICDQIEDTCDDLTSALITTSMGTMPLLNMASYQVIKGAIVSIKALLDEIKSPNVKTE